MRIGREPKEIYQAIKIPESLPKKIEEVFSKKKKKSFIPIVTKVAGSFAAICIVFTLLINTNDAFAKTVEKIPILSNIAQVLTIREIREENELDIIHAKVPNIENTGNKEFEEQINQKINEKINGILEIARQEAKEFKKMAEDYEINYQYEPINIKIDYEIKSEENGILSFIITEEQSDNMHANVHVQKFMYNIDLNTNKEIELQDLLGENYKSIIDEQINRQIQKIKEKEPYAFFEKEDFPTLEHGGFFEGIHEGQKFYINEKGNVVIVFDKYEISPGYRGMPEFEIVKK